MAILNVPVQPTLELNKNFYKQTNTQIQERRYLSDFAAVDFFQGEGSGLASSDQPARGPVSLDGGHCDWKITAHGRRTDD